MDGIWCPVNYNYSVILDRNSIPMDRVSVKRDRYFMNEHESVRNLCTH